MTTLRALLAVALFVTAITPVKAHEFWFAPLTGTLLAGDIARLTVRVGEYFEGYLAGLSVPQTIALQQYSAAGTRDLRPLMPAQRMVGEVDVPVTAAGTHLFAFENQPSMISLPADRFNAYLHDEGLEFIIAQREAEGTATTPGRERFRRFVKTLVRANDRPQDASLPAGVAPPKPIDDRTYALETGQRLEIIPVNDPLALRPGGVLELRVLIEKKPLEGALLKAWHKRGNQTLIIRSRTAADGTASFDLPYAGPWMVSVVHMVKVSGVNDVDWDSLWGNLTFGVQAAKQP